MSFCGVFENDPELTFPLASNLIAPVELFTCDTTFVSVPLLGLSGRLPAFTTHFVDTYILCAVVPARLLQLMLFFSVPFAAPVVMLAPSPVPPLQVILAVIVVVTTLT